MFDTPQKRKKGQQRRAGGYNLNVDIAPGGGHAVMEGTTEIYSVAVSCDGKYVASGGKDKLVYIWDSRSGTLIDSFRGHAKAVSALAFRLKTHQLFSGSHDRCVKHWNVDDMGYVESLYGHGTEVNSLDVLHKEKVLSSGHDRTVRLWKLETDSQLVFNGHHNSIDCVRYMSENSFVSGGVDGSLALWSAAKKKPVCMVYNAHPSASETSSGVPAPPSWITSLTSLRRTDLAISGSCDGISSLQPYHRASDCCMLCL
jgi:ribosomal RNA-processing protein 9